jgi:hypothetical protein
MTIAPEYLATLNSILRTGSISSDRFAAKIPPVSALQLDAEFL